AEAIKPGFRAATKPSSAQYAFARRWQVTGLLAEIHDRLRDRVRVKEGRSPDLSAAVVDSQSVRAAANIPGSTSGWDGGKKVGGRNRHVAVDCPGLILAVLVTTVSVQDRHAAVPLLTRLRERYFSIRPCGRTPVTRAGSSTGLREVPPHPGHRETLRRHHGVRGAAEKRWVVERTLSRLIRSRRLVRGVETLPAMHEAMVLRSMTMPMSGQLAGRRRDAFLTRPPAPAPRGG
ncbi:transposase, partial [Streptomyces sp. AV19]|uniref:transposase n=1 Tax=Streptomyces sp. AV19 TaxID=2793068 RepID=UPI0018FE324C